MRKMPHNLHEKITPDQLIEECFPQIAANAYQLTDTHCAKTKVYPQSGSPLNSRDIAGCTIPPNQVMIDQCRRERKIEIVET